MDLPGDDGSASFDDYARVVCDALQGLSGDDLTVVGHSMAGNTIPLVAAQRPVRRLVYLCALIPNPGQTLAEQMAGDAEMLNPDYTRGLGADDEGRRIWVDEELARAHLFGDCDDDTARSAIGRLSPQATYPYRLPFSLSVHPDVDTTYVLGTEDRIVNADWARRVAPERVGADVIELPSSHSPFLARPRELAEVLHGLA
jgi:pimeloyl-ACP methyl ester carboxylesterase